MAELFILIFYNLLFFQKLYFNPYLNSTGELISTFFPFWRWYGSELKSGRFPWKDDIYYKYPACIPFLSMFYPFSAILSVITHKFSINYQFKVFNSFILAHYALSSVLAYLVLNQWYSPLISLFGAITIAYAGYVVKPQNPSDVYTVCWLNGSLLPMPWGAICFGMAILGGYWPRLIYFLPVVSFLNPMALGGVLIGLPQIIPFLWYLPKTARFKMASQNASKFNTFALGSIFNQGYVSTTKVNGLLGTEYVLYMGIIPLITVFFSTSRAWLNLLIAFMGMIGILPEIGRYSCRWAYLFTFSFVWMAVNGLNNLHLSESLLFLVLIYQGFDLLNNSKIYPLFPFTEWQRKPSEFFCSDRALSRKSGDYLPFPLFTGYFNNLKTRGYTGGFALKETMEKNGIHDPNGQQLYG